MKWDRTETTATGSDERTGATATIEILEGDQHPPLSWHWEAGKLGDEGLANTFAEAQTSIDKAVDALPEQSA